MKVAVWDTYVKIKNECTLHFDIIVPKTVTSPSIIFGYGKEYLSSIDKEGKIQSLNCQLCHIEKPSMDISKSIEKKGYFILEMETIPNQLPINPSRRDKILHLRAHVDKLRFADFRNRSDEDINQLILKYS
jgi:hypothetical protein